MAGALQRLQVDARATAPAHASPARRRFDKLLRQPEQRRAELHAWAEAMPFSRNGHSGYQILWNPAVADQLKEAA